MSAVAPYPEARAAVIAAIRDLDGASATAPAVIDHHSEGVLVDGESLRCTVGRCAGELLAGGCPAKSAATLRHLVADLVAARRPRLWQDAHFGRMGMRSGGIRAGQENCPRCGDCCRRPRRPGGRRERHYRGRAAVVPAGIRALEAAPYLAERRNRNDV